MITLTFSDTIAASSIPSSVTLTYARFAHRGHGDRRQRPRLRAAGLPVTPAARTTRKIGGTSAVVTASTLVSGTTVKLTVTKITDPSGNLTAGGPGPVTGTLSSSIKDVFGNTASTSPFASASIKLF